MPRLGSWWWRGIFWPMPRTSCPGRAPLVTMPMARHRRSTGQKMVSQEHKPSVRRQCALLTPARSNLNYEPKGESAGNLRFMETPWYGSRQMARFVQRSNHTCGRHRVRRLMRLVPIYPEPNTSQKHPQRKIWPYLLRNVGLTAPIRSGVPISRSCRSRTASSIW